jgi:2-phosphoglycerate kinase
MFEVPGFHDEVFWDWKDVITASEMQILKRLGFQMQVSRIVYTVRSIIRRGVVYAQTMMGLEERSG